MQFFDAARFCASVFFWQRAYDAVVTFCQILVDFNYLLFHFEPNWIGRIAATAPWSISEDHMNKKDLAGQEVENKAFEKFIYATALEKRLILFLLFEERIEQRETDIMFCWRHIVRETYAMLFTLHKRNVLKLELVLGKKIIHW